jgi:transcription antitermination protein NusB
VVLPLARHGARERALEILYEAQAKTSTVAQILAALPLSPDPYTVDLVTGVSEHEVAHDAVLRKFVKGGWTLERMPTLDLLVLRLGVEELANQPQVPTAVVLDEAVQLAKAFSTDDSGRFVNGMLAAIARDIRNVGCADGQSVAVEIEPMFLISDGGDLEGVPDRVLPIGLPFDDETPFEDENGLTP